MNELLAVLHNDLMKRVCC